MISLCTACEIDLSWETVINGSPRVMRLAGGVRETFVEIRCYCWRYCVVGLMYQGRRKHKSSVKSERSRARFLALKVVIVGDCVDGG